MNTEHTLEHSRYDRQTANALVFHIGWMRTGTTFLQGVFERQNDIQLSLKNRFFSYDPYYLLGEDHYNTLIQGEGQHQIAVDSDENYAMGRFKTHLREKDRQRNYNFKAELNFVYHDIPEMIARMQKVAPNAKIFGVIRKQADWFASVYKHDVYHFGVDETFERFYESNLGQSYRDAADYSNVIESFQQAFGKENVKIQLFEDFIEDQQQFVNELSDFLGLAVSVGEKKNLKKNASTSGLFTHLHRIANTLSETNLEKPERRAYKLIRSAINRLDRIATSQGWKLPGQAVSEAMQKKIWDDYRTSNQKLAEVIGGETSLKKYQYI